MNTKMFDQVVLDASNGLNLWTREFASMGWAHDAMRVRKLARDMLRTPRFRAPLHGCYLEPVTRKQHAKLPWCDGPGPKWMLVYPVEGETEEEDKTGEIEESVLWKILVVEHIEASLWRMNPICQLNTSPMGWVPSLVEFLVDSLEGNVAAQITMEGAAPEQMATRESLCVEALGQYEEELEACMTFGHLYECRGVRSCGVPLAPEVARGWVFMPGSVPNGSETLHIRTPARRMRGIPRVFTEGVLHQGVWTNNEQPTLDATSTAMDLEPQVALAGVRL